MPPQQPQRVYEIDGRSFQTLDEFYDEISRVLVPGVFWGRNLDAFNDILRGGFGTPDDGFVLRWANSDISRQRLGYEQTAQAIRQQLERCHPTNRERILETLSQALRHEGDTVFDWLVEIVRRHGPGGEWADDGVVLELA
jgi:RNAse (barnase) inhibitor barstar